MTPDHITVIVIFLLILFLVGLAIASVIISIYFDNKRRREILDAVGMFTKKNPDIERYMKNKQCSSRCTKKI